MSTDDILDAYDFPDDFGLHRAEDMDRVESADGTAFYALVNHHTGERHLVHADIVDYDGLLAHPMTGGLAGFLGVLGGFVCIIFGGYVLGMSADSTIATVAALLGGVVGGFIVANVLLYLTPIGDGLFRFLEWNDHRTLIMARRDSQ